MMRIGHGFDVHAFGGEGPIIIGGVRIPYEKGLLAHSDGDVAAHAVCDLPILCSLTMQADGSLFFGGNIFETAPMLEEMGADAVGINCSTGPDQLENIIQNLAGSLSVPVIAKPNAGMPTINDQGIAVYDMTPEYFGKSMKRLVDLGASMVGGCCGTDPSYIKALVNAIR